MTKTLDGTQPLFPVPEAPETMAENEEWNGAFVAYENAAERALQSIETLQEVPQAYRSSRLATAAEALRVARERILEAQLEIIPK